MSTPTKVVLGTVGSAAILSILTILSYAFA
ncbi:hypothetical protein [Halopenitus persicus]|jgi:hypothetical protein|uniref:Uncharacterized protein n=1 Tax=Halopenitus persicus TaxID=1048396 RepID=A0A1H3M1E6_9EURY|nr:hypothetical protein SAMN05216564_108100 [Halopenitus persicus]